MSSDARLRALERGGDRQAYLRECWRVGGREMFEAALREGDEVEVENYFADGRPAALVPGTPCVVVESVARAGSATFAIRPDLEWRVDAVSPFTGETTKWFVSWLRPRGIE